MRMHWFTSQDSSYASETTDNLTPPYAEDSPPMEELACRQLNKHEQNISKETREQWKP